MRKEDLMSLAIRLEVLPGKSVLEKFSNAAKYGFNAIELPGRYLDNYRDELLSCKERLPLPVCSISLGFRGSLLSANEEVREECRHDIKVLLDLCAELGAIGLVMPPILHMDNQERLAGLSPAAPAEDRIGIKTEEDLILEQLPELAGYAEQNGVLLMLEPVNRDETDYLYRLEQAVSLCEQVHHPGLAITADWFHMHLEEADMAAALRQCGKWLKHFHISDNPGRIEPRAGGLDFKAAFDVLRKIGYQGYIVLECRSLSGLADEVLPRSVAYLRSIMRLAENA